MNHAMESDFDEEQDQGLAEKLVQVGTSAKDGTNSRLITVEAGFGRGFSGLQMIGQTGNIVDDGKERARMALERLGIDLPAKKLLLSVSPGDVKVDGNHLDLAIAVAIAALIKKKPPVIDPGKWVFAAEIGLGGELRPIPGVVCHGIAAMASDVAGVVVAEENLCELQALEVASARTNQTLRYHSFKNLHDVLDWLWSGIAAEKPQTPVTETKHHHVECNFDDMDLSEEMTLAAMTVAAGMHSVLLRGVPGCGKSMFAKRIKSLLPDLSAFEHLKVLEIHSCHPERIDRPILQGRPPYRSPHHFASASAMLGGHDCPGEVALASGGVLFLDEFPEFRRDVIEALREPLESGEVQISRAQSKRTWRAKMMLIAAANNCPCGWSGSKKRRCECPTSRLVAYRNRLSGPILDRIDLHLNMPERSDGVSRIFVGPDATRSGITAKMKDQVERARLYAQKRNLEYGVDLNRDIPPRYLSAALRMSERDVELLVKKLIPPHVSTRAVVRCFRVARTIADLAGRNAVDTGDVMQAWSWQAYESAKLRGEILDSR